MRQLIRWYKNNPNKGVIKIAFFVVIGLFLAIISTALSTNNMSNVKKQDIDENYEFNTIDELCEYYGIDFYSRNPSEAEGYLYDVKVKFNKSLFDSEGKSNKDFFLIIISNMARINKYNSFRIVDPSQDLTIEVKCKDMQIYDTLINGVSNYFELQEELASLKNYEEIPESDLIASSYELLQLLDKKWSKTAIEVDDYVLYNNTKQYFKEGFITKDREERVSSIVFTKNYKKTVINELAVDSEIAYKKASLGKPTFEDTQIGMIGYKGKNFYAFLTDDKIAIYRRLEQDYDSFINLSRRYINKEITINQFVDQLTIIWPDFDTYDMQNDSFLLTYPQRGVAVKFNIEGRNGIIFYNNCLLDSSIMEEFVSKSEDFILQRKIDLVYEVARDRLKKEASEYDKCIEYQNEHKTEANPLANSKYAIYADLDYQGNVYKMNFISRDGLNPNQELIDLVATFAWLNDDVFIYSIRNKGLYYFNLETGKKGTIKLGNEKFDIYNCYNGLLKYDNSKLIIEQGE
jgi:hypothetical protein